jgi:hypothetical protein
VRVRDVVTKLRPFAANIAYLCHDFAPNFFCFVLPASIPQIFRAPFHRAQIGDFRRESHRDAPKNWTHDTGSLPNLQYTRNRLESQPVYVPDPSHAVPSFTKAECISATRRASRVLP